MPEVRPFRGVRFNPNRQANLGRVIAPPYDTVDSALVPAAVSIAAIENVDLGNGSDSHATASRRYREWRASCILTADEHPALYVHDHSFMINGEPRRRRGVLARVRLAPWADRVILPHERVFPGPRDERAARLRAVGVNLSPLYLLYRDPLSCVASAVAEATKGLMPVASGIDARQGGHTLTAIIDPKRREAIAALLTPLTLFVADGHHRYEAALAYRDDRARRGKLADDDPANFVLALLAPVTDPGVIVRPTHRVISHLPTRSIAEVRATLAPLFEVVIGDVPAAGARPTPICRIVFEDRNDTVTLTVLPRAGRPEQARLPTGRGEVWRHLDVAIGDHVVLDLLLGANSADRVGAVRFTPDEAEARAAVAAGAAQLAMLYAPPALDQLIAVAEAGDLLPPKSTYFDPKPPAGLVISDLSI